MLDLEKKVKTKLREIFSISKKDMENILKQEDNSLYKLIKIYIKLKDYIGDEDIKLWIKGKNIHPVFKEFENPLHLLKHPFGCSVVLGYFESLERN